MPINEQRIFVVGACFFKHRNNPFDELPPRTLPAQGGIGYQPGKMPSPIARISLPKCRKLTPSIAETKGIHRVEAAVFTKRLCGERKTKVRPTPDVHRVGVRKPAHDLIEIGSRRGRQYPAIARPRVQSRFLGSARYLMTPDNNEPRMIPSDDSIHRSSLVLARIGYPVRTDLQALAGN